MKIVTVETMQELDKLTIADGTPGVVLMERAGAGAVQQLLKFLDDRIHPSHWQRFTVVAGKGNNGGDAYVMARLLRESTGKPVKVYAVCKIEDLKDDSRAQAEKLPASVALEVVQELPAAAFAEGTLVLDGLLGTGISGPLRPPYDRLITQINESGRPVMAIDIPSGLNGDSGEVASVAVRADLTVTMALPKPGLLSENGRPYCGSLRCVDIGTPARFVAAAEASGEALFADDITALLGRRPADSHKGSFGHVAVLAGSRRYTGAPLLTACAALRSGAGMVTMAVPAGIKPQLPLIYQALIALAVPDCGNGCFGNTGLDVIEALLQEVNCVVFGPGIGPSPESRHVLVQLSKSGVPLVIDADGLRIVAANPDVLTAGAAVVLTPHPGEMKQLLAGFNLNDYIAADRMQQARKLAECAGVYVILKGQGTVLAHPDGRAVINSSGSAALATAGTGDVLAGMVAAFVAQGESVWQAIKVAAFVHGYAGELTPLANRALVADDLPVLAGRALRELSPFA